jgi:GH15 family glucan-1,4-alpha-glucosidase
MVQRIEDYALIGDCQTAALVGCNRSIDWLCLPRFDSGACFASLLGTPRNGRWLLHPAGRAQSRRRYLDGTLVLVTEHETADGLVEVSDFMPLREGDPHLVRIVEGRRGLVPMRMELILRPDYGSIVPWVRKFAGGERVGETAAVLGSWGQTSWSVLELGRPASLPPQEKRKYVADVDPPSERR